MSAPPASPRATLARLHSNALQTGYQVRGCGGVVIYAPDHAVALYLLSYGWCVVEIHGQWDKTQWLRHKAAALALFDERRREQAITAASKARLDM